MIQMSSLSLHGAVRDIRSLRQLDVIPEVLLLRGALLCHCNLVLR